MNISVLVGIKNNLEDTKEFYRIFREVYPDVELCFVSYGSTDDTHNWLDFLVDNNLKYFHDNEVKTLSDAYNKCAEIATRDYIVFLHNDIVVCEGFLENIMKHLSGNKRAVSYTTIEPPIFADHERPGKLIQDFGKDFSTLDYQGLSFYVRSEQEKRKDTISKGISFFMALSRDTFLSIGGFDNLFNPMFCEDDDLIRRLSLHSVEQITSLDALCYHLVSKTSRFSSEFKSRTKLIEWNSNRNFVRKWGSYSYLKNENVYDVGIIIKNSNLDIIDTLEPFFSTLYVDIDPFPFIQRAQSNTKFDLRKKVMEVQYIGDLNPSLFDNDMIIGIDANTVDMEIINKITNIPGTIKQHGVKEPGLYGLEGKAFLSVRSLNTYQHKLISLYSTYYKDKLLL